VAVDVQIEGVSYLAGAAATSTLDIAANMSKLNLEFMSLATDVVPLLTRGLEGVNTVQRPIESMVGAFQSAGNFLPNAMHQFLQAMGGVEAGLQAFRGALDQAVGDIEMGFGSMLEHLPFTGRSGANIYRAGVQNTTADIAAWQPRVRARAGRRDHGLRRTLGCPQLHARGYGQCLVIYTEEDDDCGNCARGTSLPRGQYPLCMTDHRGRAPWTIH
jgi:hypothetical protein